LCLGCKLCHRHGPWEGHGISNEPEQSGVFAAHSQHSESEEEDRKAKAACSAVQCWSEGMAAVIVSQSVSQSVSRSAIVGPWSRPLHLLNDRGPPAPAPASAATFHAGHVVGPMVRWLLKVHLPPPCIPSETSQARLRGRPKPQAPSRTSPPKTLWQTTPHDAV
jgi:hypothetical protein